LDRILHLSGKISPLTSGRRATSSQEKGSILDVVDANEEEKKHKIQNDSVMTG
jgi:hypothetical protein